MTLEQIEREPVLLDIRDMPGFNPASNTKDAPQRDVSTGQVYWNWYNKVSCWDHGAMLCVNEDRTIWRCISCGAGAYRVPQAPPNLFAE